MEAPSSRYSTPTGPRTISRSSPGPLWPSRQDASCCASRSRRRGGSGHSWAAIGAVLGLSRQATQQRFGAGKRLDEGAEYRWLGPVTAIDEMRELELAGRRGWRTIGAGMLKHRMERTDTQWEHRRVVWRRAAGSYEVDGWVVAVRAFPWLYLVRDLRTPPQD